MNRHRYLGKVGQVCGFTYADSTGEVCNLNYSASLHFNDDDHPYGWPDLGAEIADYCMWEQQNIPGGFEARYFCSRTSADSVHHHPVTFSETTNNPGAPVLDVPAEDGGPVGSWAFTPGTGIDFGLPGSVGILPPVYTRPEPTGSSVSERLRKDMEVTDGPLGVRQYEWTELGSEKVYSLLAALARTGAVFCLETWWPTYERCLARVTWGELAYLSQEEILARVEAHERA